MSLPVLSLTNISTTGPDTVMRLIKTQSGEETFESSILTKHNGYLPGHVQGKTHKFAKDRDKFVLNLHYYLHFLKYHIIHLLNQQWLPCGAGWSPALKEGRTSVGWSPTTETDYYNPVAVARLTCVQQNNHGHRLLLRVEMNTGTHVMALQWVKQENLWRVSPDLFYGTNLPGWLLPLTPPQVKEKDLYDPVSIKTLSALKWNHTP